MVPARLLSLLLLALAATRAACDGIVTNYTDLQLALASGGTWTVVNNIAMQSGTVYAGAGNTNVTLTLVGACAASPCALDGASRVGHFNVANGTLHLVGLTLANGVRGLSPDGTVHDDCVTINTVRADHKQFCSCTVVQPGAIFTATDVVWSNNLGYGLGTALGGGYGGALALVLAPVFSFSLLGCSFLNNSVIQTTGRIPARANYGGAVSIEQSTSAFYLSGTPGTGLIKNSLFSGNVANQGGGAVYGRVIVGNVTVDGCVFENNVAGQVAVATITSSDGNTISGGALFLTHAPGLNFHYLAFSSRAYYLFFNTSFISNSAGIPAGPGATLPFPPATGGAIFSGGAGFRIGLLNCTFKGNSAHQGGALFVDGRTLVPKLVTEVQTTTTSTSGDYATSEQVTDFNAASGNLAFLTGYGTFISNTQFLDNMAVGGFFSSGGAIFLTCAQMNISRSLFVGNSVPDPAPPGQPGVSAGGAILATNDCSNHYSSLPIVTPLFIAETDFIANAASYFGSAIALAQNGRFRLSPFPSHDSGIALSATSCTFSANGNGSSLLGGAVFSEANATASFTNCAFCNNHAQRGGAAFLGLGSTADFSGSNFSSNMATLGGCVYESSGSRLSLSTVATNHFSANIATIGAVLYTEAVLGSLAVSSVAVGVLVNLSGSPWILGSNNVPQNYGQAVAHAPTSYTILANGMPVGATVLARSGVGLGISVVLTDAYNQTVLFWQDLTVKAACAASPTSLSGTLEASYALGSASLSTLALSGSILQSFNLSLTLASSTLPLFSPALVVSLTVIIAPCDAGETFDAASLKCLCSGGMFKNSSGFCQQCMPGSYSPTFGSVGCLSCSPGSISNANFTGCSLCSVGEYQSGEVCTRCPTGTFSPSPGAATCLSNPPGQVSVTVTTATTSLLLYNVSVWALGAGQYSVLKQALASLLNLSGSSVTISNPIPRSAMRMLLISTGLTVAVTSTDNATAAAMLTTLSNASYFASQLTATLQLSMDASLSVISGAAVTLPTTSTAFSTQPCAAGTFLNSTTLVCEACAAGSISPASQTQCFQCLANSYAANNSCLSCPSGLDWVSRSSAGSSSLLQCLCDYGRFPSPLPTSNSSNFTCTQCPVGALCDSNKWLAPLALEGFWRPNSSELEFYECDPDRCEAETVATQFANCREGRDGPVCSICKAGYAMVSDNCILCSANQAYTSWPRTRLYGFMCASTLLSPPQS